jgi:ankyrin repeat protein
MSVKSAQDGDDLLTACREGDIISARSLVYSGTSVDFQQSQPSSLGLTPSMCCCFKNGGGFPRILKFLIDMGADFNRANNAGCTPLFIAARYNSHECVSLLLKNGADIDRATIFMGQTTPLNITAKLNHYQSMTLLLRHGADADRTDYRGATPLHIAAYYNSNDCVSLLLQHGVAVDAIDTSGKTALWWASHEGHQSIVELLVQSGADFEIADNVGKTAKDIATENDHAAVARYLDNQSKRRRRLPFAEVRFSIKDVEDSDAAVMKVLQNDDLAREIRAYL